MIAWLKLLFWLMIDFIIFCSYATVTMIDNLVAGEGCARM